MNKIAVLYLARIKEGLHDFEKFARSYRQYPAGQAHDLIVIYKGDFTKTEKMGAEAIFKDIPHQPVWIADEVGFDIHAYMHVAEKLPHQYVCPFNTYTEIMTEDWLKKLYAPFADPDVGIVGTSASYESIQIGHKILQKVLFLSKTLGKSLDKDIQRKFAYILEGPHNDHNKKKISSKKKKEFIRKYILFLLPLFFICMHSLCKILPRRALKKMIPYKVRAHMLSDKCIGLLYHIFLNRHLYRDIYKLRPTFFAKCSAAERTKKFEAYWHAITKTGAPLDYAFDFPVFPNPHIRSTGFMLEREILLNFKNLKKTKVACCAFESGRESLTNYFLKRGKKTLLIGANGTVYPLEEWPRSQTFRLDQQQNLIAKDNHSTAYEAAGASQKVIEYLTWGDYVGPAPKVISKLDFSKEDKLTVSDLSIGKVKESPFKVSIVIPTHNRLQLLKQAIFSVVQQSFSDWELIIFDNASSEPIKAYIESLADSRIRFERSEEFLPVTESWNQAIDCATGEYVMFFGNDDGLAPKYFEKLNAITERFRGPDFIYSGLYLFGHPGVFPWCRQGSLEITCNASFFKDNTAPFLLSTEEAQKAWKDAVNFRRNFCFNMQGLTFKRSFLETLRIDGKIFHSPFPDYYLATLAMAYGKNIVVCPEPLAIQGVSQESFGYTLFNNLEQQGAEMLHTTLEHDSLFMEYKENFLPGERYQTNYILTMGHVAKNAPERVSTAFGIRRYRRYQILSHLQRLKNSQGLWKTPIGKTLWQQMSLPEKAFSILVNTIYYVNIQIVIRIIERIVSPTTFRVVPQLIATGKYSTLPEVFKMLEKQNETFHKAA